MFFTSGSHGFCVSDGGPGGVTVLDHSIDTDFNARLPKEDAVLNDTIYFTASDGYIHRTDGTVAGTVKVAPYSSNDLFSGSNSMPAYHQKNVFLRI